MEIEEIKTAYRRYAGIYDALFGPIFHPGRKMIIETLGCRRNERILEVGVGTGLSLPLYPVYANVTGIDVSQEMLEKARQRVAEQNLEQVEAIMEMDAENMRFADDSFDKVVAMYVVSVVPNPVRLVDEMCRVCKPGGEIFIVNHFHSRNAIIKGSETLLSPFSKLAGFRPNLDLNKFLQSTSLEVVDIRKTNLFGYWKILRCRNTFKKAIAV